MTGLSRSEDECQPRLREFISAAVILIALHTHSPLLDCCMDPTPIRPGFSQTEQDFLERTILQMIYNCKFKKMKKRKEMGKRKTYIETFGVLNHFCPWNKPARKPARSGIYEIWVDNNYSISLCQVKRIIRWR